MYRKLILLSCVAVVALFSFSAVASADLQLTPFGGTTDLRPGSHGDLTVGADFTYPNTTESVRRMVIDTPAGGLGNPNAIPYADRCTEAVFQAGTCDLKSQIGTVAITARLFGTTDLPLTGTISMMQNPDGTDVPTPVGVYIHPPLGTDIRSHAVFSPLTVGPDADFRLRSVVIDDFPRSTTIGVTPIPLQITKFAMTLWGRAANGNYIITNPTRCDTWNSYGYASAWDSNTNADSDPTFTGTNTFVKSAPYPVTPDCAHPAPFTLKAGASVSTPERDISPTFSTVIDNPGFLLGDQGADIPKTVVATMPPTLNIDFNQLGRLCSQPQVAAQTCPASTQVGSASIVTPLIRAGLSGNAYLTNPSGGGTLPDLVIFIKGQVNFMLRGTNHYVNGNQLQTTFNNLPQAGFSKFTLNITGGTNGLLKTVQCPDGSSMPGSSSVTLAITGYSGQSSTTASDLSFKDCFGINKFKKRHSCVRTKWKISPRYHSRDGLMKSELWVKNRHTKKYKLIKRLKKSPFRFLIKTNTRKFHKRANYRYKVRIVYHATKDHPKPAVYARYSKFKKC